MKAADIRETFLKYFEKNGHTRVRSSSLIPAGDPTLLFTNAGMVQFKDSFLGLHDPGYQRATSSQKCVRAGGKRNDLENVGFTPRHHTFFEMLGNFSFGDYFKKDAIAFAWELVTSVYGIPKDRLRATVFETDDEAFELWKGQGLPSEWIIRLGEKDNFWAMGDTGPCGPCSEIHFDLGSDRGCDKPDCSPACDCGRFLEIWNLVFMQFNRDAQGKMSPLPRPSVDTGAGLERMAAVLQAVPSNYDTDLFIPLIRDIEKKTGMTYGEGKATDVSFRVVADHLRSGVFLLGDDVIPSNEGRGYVLRRIVRRAIRHGKKLGQDEPFIYRLVPAVVDVMSPVFPELVKQQPAITELMKEEEVRFHETLDRGLSVLEEAVGAAKSQKSRLLPGEIAFKLYDTFGFPLDLTEIICQEQELGVDKPGFDRCMEEQRGRSVWVGATPSETMERITKSIQQASWLTEFTGYHDALSQTASVKALFKDDGQPAHILKQGQQGYVAFDKTPFYAESGGQAGDRGLVQWTTGEADVTDTIKTANRTLHRIMVKRGDLTRDAQNLSVEVDASVRRKTATNHTATHLLHAALRLVLGDRVRQAGSLVEPSRLRFDFTFPRGLTANERSEIEHRVNEEVRKADEVTSVEMDYAEAIKAGALAFFDEKYGNRVRVVRVGPLGKPFSAELCGGTHLSNTAQIGYFKILSESSIASGTRRIEAITGEQSLEYLVKRNQVVDDLETLLGLKGEQVAPKIEVLLREVKGLKKENDHYRLTLAQTKTIDSDQGTELWNRAVNIGNLKVVMEDIPAADTKILRTLVDKIRDKLHDNTVVLLTTTTQDRVTLCLGLTKDMLGRFNASELIQPLAKEIGGSGGGRADFAQAGGTEKGNLSQAFQALRTLLEGKV